MKKSSFLSEFTLRICSTLNFEKALSNAFVYLTNFIPVDGLYLDTFNEDFSKVKRMCVVCNTGFNCCTQVLDMPKEMAEAIQNKTSNVTLTSDVLKFTDDTKFKQVTGASGNSGIAIRIKKDKKSVGFIILRVKGENRYSKKDIAFLDGIEVPLSLAFSNFIAYNDVVQKNNQLQDDFNYLQLELEDSQVKDVVGSEEGIFKILKNADQVLQLSNNIIITGDTGVGKEVVANYIHQNSTYKNGSFVKIDCGAIPESLIESELFGYEKGAFTGANTFKKGKIERAEGGTLFFDEIGELPLHIQTRLLRALQHKEIVRLGSSKPIKVNCRIMAATNRNLEEMVKKGDFREDLWYRLNVFPIHIPPLRERKSDIPVLINSLIAKKCKTLGIKEMPVVSEELMELLVNYEWPGNVREMENVIERELILNHNKGLLFSCILGNERRAISEPLQTNKVVTDLDTVIRNHILSVVDKVGGKISGKGGAAELLGLHPNTLRNKMIKLGIL